MKLESGRASIVIRTGTPGTVVFEVMGSTGEVLAKSMPFPTICRLEAALASMGAAVDGTWRATCGPEGGTLLLVGRRRIPLHGTPSEAEVSLAIQVVAEARIIDLRPEGRRRQDLTGLRCDLSDG
ncbi:hypothetical protein [Methylibium petroleiphilum]|nr:hypothetical protein [Methylibium petroleiphilum]